MEDHGLIIWEEDRKGIERRVASRDVKEGDEIEVTVVEGRSYFGIVENAHYTPTASTWRRVELSIFLTGEREGTLSVLTNGDVVHHKPNEKSGTKIGTLDYVKKD